MKKQLIQLFGLTIRDPAQAAQVLSNIRFDRMTGWTILALAVTLNTLVYFLSITLFPAPVEMSIPLLSQPYLVWFMLGSSTVIFVFAFYWVGHSLGGRASFDTILLMVGWLQYMRLAVQVASLVLMILSPSLAQMFVMAAGLYGVWILLNYLKEAHGFETFGKAIGVIVLSAVGLTVGLSVFLSLFTATVIGMS
ncbi:Yip1 domain protein [Shimia sp. SK013]|uniref:YIP1 family protein n=1 Tax=Shimia sp. SK013 TaxID=1389006 RepID=UPI0006B60B21|nr:YIP1 family protein [Shimia sp. SK013]KPA22537.1 Yip1 domain protein [Shimia sp. SK013]